MRKKIKADKQSVNYQCTLSNPKLVLITLTQQYLLKKLMLALSYKTSTLAV